MIKLVCAHYQYKALDFRRYYQGRQGILSERSGMGRSRTIGVVGYALPNTRGYLRYVEYSHSEIPRCAGYPGTSGMSGTRRPEYPETSGLPGVWKKVVNKWGIPPKKT